MGHAGPKEDWGSGYRSKEELDLWKAKCPIKRLEKILCRKKFIDQARRSQIKSRILKEIDAAISFARTSPLPDRCELLKDVVSKKKVILCV